MDEVLIIGGGLSGLVLGLRLHEAGVSFRLLEGRPEFGGRIRSVHRGKLAVELGPSWYWPEANPLLTELIASLGLEGIPQYNKGDALFEQADGSLIRQPHQAVDPRHSLRIERGGSALIGELVARLPAEQLHLSHKLTGIAKASGDTVQIDVTTPEGRVKFVARKVVSTLPPRLLATAVPFHPRLPEDTLDFFMKTPTWMAGEAKFFALYDKPFWREDGLSGTALSSGGPLSECHDASHPDGPAALLGFLSSTATSDFPDKESLSTACLAQLTRYFGKSASAATETLIQDWKTDPFLATPSDRPLGMHPIYGLPEKHRAPWGDLLQFAGTETARSNGGYLEGALESAEAVAAKLIEQ